MVFDFPEIPQLNRLQPEKKSKIIKQSVTLFLGDSKEAFAGWENLTIQKDIDSLANAFTFQLPQKFEQTGTTFKLSPGVKVAIYVNEEKVITGRIDKVEISLGEQEKQVQISGRSLCADIIDCSVTGPMEYKNLKIDALARKLVAPFNLKVFTSVVPTVTIPKITIKPGDTVFEVLDKYARLQGFFWVATAAGNIRLTKGADGEERFRAKSRIGEGFNMKAGALTIDDSQRFSNYTVKGQQSGSDNYPGVIANVAEGKATDEGLNRFRPHTVVANGSTDTATAKTRAQWEATTRLAKSIVISTLVQNWLQEDGKTLWGVNQLVGFKSKTLGVDGDFLTTTIQFVKSHNEGTITRIGLTRQDAYDPEPIIKGTSRGVKSLEDIVAFSQRNK